MIKNHSKIIFKIFVTYALTSFLILSLVAGIFFSFKPAKKIPRTIEQNIVLYLNTIEKEYFNPPTEENFFKVKNEFGIIFQNNFTKALAHQVGAPVHKRLLDEDDFLGDDLRLGRTKRFFYAYIPSQSGDKVWYFPLDNFPRGFHFPFIGIAISLIVILAFSFFTVRWMIRPINVLMKGISEISNGNLNYRIQTKSGNEFEIIAENFNSMTEKIEKMLKQKEHLVRDVSHELRSPLTRIQVASSLIENEKISLQIKQDVQAMDKMLSELLESYRFQEGKGKLHISKFNLKELIETLESEYKNNFLNFQTIFDSQQTEMIADALQIERVFRNIIENSIKYKKTNSKLFRIHVSAVNDQFQISFEDDGMGIHQQHLDHLFEPFYRVDEVRTPGHNGFGLGLSIVKSIIESHKGCIEIQSEKNQGTVVKITIPRLYNA